MGGSNGLIAELGELFRDNALIAFAFAVALVAIASTPIAFAWLARTTFFEVRRGRTHQKPAFSSVVCGMMLVMAIPAIFCGIVIKSRHFDENRYAFDPNKTYSPLDQGRSFHSLKEADEAVRKEMQRLAEERKNLVNGVKKLDDAMLALRAASGQSPATARAMPAVLERLASLRAAVGVDGPQQLIDATAPPAGLPNVPAVAASVPTSVAPPVAAAGGLSKAEVDADLAAVPAPQRPLAAMLPLLDVPAGWEVGKSGASHVETFHAENLFEKIDGRAESFLQYDVKGMAYTYYHPTGDDSDEVQLYIFEMGGPLKALGKYGSEKPDGVKTLAIGSEGYAAAGSTLFYAGPFYTQIVSTKDDPKFAAFALELARRIAAQQAPKSDGASPGNAAPKGTPEAIFAHLPGGPKRSSSKFVSQDVFGYSFLADVFMADYQEGEAKWQGLLRPYATAEEAKAIFDQYVEGAKADGAEVKDLPTEGDARMVASTGIGLVDVIFQKGNVVGGVNGAPQSAAELAEKFARDFAKSLPANVPAMLPEKTQ